MANIKISDLTAAASVSGTQQFEVNESGTSKKVTGAQIATYIEGEISSSPSFTGQTSVAAGTSAAPSITVTGDNNTGVYFPASDTVGISTGGTLRVSVDSSGNLITTGNIELGNASDTTISRSAAGVIAVEGGIIPKENRANTFTTDQTITGTLVMSSSFLRNRIINGDMRIDQRNAGASVTPTVTAYTLDRWNANVSVTSKYSVQQNAGSVTPPAGFTNYLGITSLSAYAVLAGDFFGITQSIEGYNVADLDFGKTTAKTVTLGFWVRSSLTGTFGGSIFNGAISRSYAFTYTISAANTWEYKTVSIAGDTSGSWLTTNGSGLTLCFSLGTGSTATGTAGVWTAGAILNATGSVSVVGTNAATWYVTGVQLEAGSVATPFERRQYGQELSLCQRYYENIGIAAAMFPWNSTSTIVRTTVSFAVQKRAVPLVTLGTKTSGTGTLSVVDTTVNAVLLGGTGSANDVVVYNTPTASAEL